MPRRPLGKLMGARAVERLAAQQARVPSGMRSEDFFERNRCGDDQLPLADEADEAGGVGGGGGTGEGTGEGLEEGRDRAGRDSGVEGPGRSDSDSNADANAAANTASGYDYIQGWEGDFDTLADDVQPTGWLRVTDDARERQQVWVGCPGGGTRLHFDHSHNFVAQISGEKRFLLSRPSSWPLVRDFPRIHPHVGFTTREELGMTRVGGGDSGRGDGGGRAGHGGSESERGGRRSSGGSGGGGGERGGAAAEGGGSGELDGTEPVIAKKGPSVPVLNATLFPGDLLYVPPFWWHHVAVTVGGSDAAAHDDARGDTTAGGGHSSGSSSSSSRSRGSSRSSSSSSSRSRGRGRGMSVGLNFFSSTLHLEAMMDTRLPAVLHGRRTTTTRTRRGGQGGPFATIESDRFLAAALVLINVIEGSLGVRGSAVTLVRRLLRTRYASMGNLKDDAHTRYLDWCVRPQRRRIVEDGEGEERGETEGIGDVGGSGGRGGGGMIPGLGDGLKKEEDGEAETAAGLFELSCAADFFGSSRALEQKRQGKQGTQGTQRTQRQQAQQKTRVGPERLEDMAGVTKDEVRAIDGLVRRFREWPYCEHKGGRRDDNNGNDYNGNNGNTANSGTNNDNHDGHNNHDNHHKTRDGDSDGSDEEGGRRGGRCGGDGAAELLLADYTEELVSYVATPQKTCWFLRCFGHSALFAHLEGGGDGMT
jgi:hypothetical protein